MTSPQRELRDNIARLLLRDLEGMRREVEHYTDDAGPWKAVPGMANCGGTLVLHIAGNLQHYIGAVLGHSSYVRRRDLEFVRRGVSRAELLQELDATVGAVSTALSTVEPSLLEGMFPECVQGAQVPADLLLIHLATHLTYHLGQLDYHRRCVTGNATSVGTLSIPALLSPFPPLS
jgi:hypothetical protein